MTEIVIAVLALLIPVVAGATWYFMARERHKAITEARTHLAEMYGAIIAKQDERLELLWDRLMAASDLGLEAITQDRMMRRDVERLRAGVADTGVVVPLPQDDDWADSVGRSVMGGTSNATED